MDRIFDAYNGSMGAEFMHKTRERLHWICSQVWGSRVLDVGCSQGVVPIILARMGYAVDGLDINPEAIAFANEQLAKEPADIQSKVTYVTADFGRFVPPKDRTYDVITMSEVLEHLVRPQDFIRKAFSILPEKGRLIVTVPFGINDDPDHRQTFYLTSIYSLIHPFFEIGGVKIFGGWIGLSCRRRSAETKDPPVISLTLMRQAEEAFFKIERPLRDGTLAVRNQRQALKTEQAKLAEDLRAAEKARLEAEARVAAADATPLRSELADVRGQLSASEGEKQALQTSLEVERKASVGLQDQVNMLKAMLQFATSRQQDNSQETRLLEYSQEVRDLRSALDQKRDEIVDRAEQIGRLNGRIEYFEESNKRLLAERDKFQSDCESSKARVLALESEREELRRTFETETEQHKRADEAAQERLRSMEAEFAEKERILSEVELKYKAESKVHKKFSSEAFRLGKQKTALEQKIRALVLERDGLRVRLKRLDAAYEKLSKAKLGRLTLRYWRWKDAVKAYFVRKSPTIPPPVPAKPSASVLSAKSVVPVQPVSEKQTPIGDEGFFSRMAEKIKDMPESNGSRYYARLNKRIAIICDQFYWDSVKAAADFVYIAPNKWQECIKNIDCLLVVSAWHGLGNGTDWQGLAYENTKRRMLAYEIIDTCKARNIPTIFYSKEDPPSYKEFLGLAQRCDCVFTSDDGCVAKYQMDCGHERVFPLRFCINPTYHNPVGIRHCAKERNVFFAGSWMTKFPERCADMERMLDGVLAAGRGLNIVDRCYHLRSDERYSYPKKYLKFQSPAIDHDSLQKIHKLFDWCININTVKDSSTMFANRVYELQANGNLLLSNYSLGVSNTFPNVFLIHDQKEVAQIFNGFTDEEVYERQTAGVRRVMTGETCYDRVAEMLQKVGLAEPPPVRKVLVIATKQTDRLCEMFDLQTYGAKELTDLAHVTPAMYAAADIVAFFDAEAEYGAYYLEDMVNGFKYTDCDYITKAAYIDDGGMLVEGREHDYVSEIGDRTRTVFWRAAFTLDELLGMTGATVRANGYAADHFGYTRRPRIFPRIENPAVSAVIPVHNNGRFLYGRSFAALRRSSLFPKMEVIIVDDGSTDGYTPKVVRELERCYPNVRSFFFNDGGSGSPSRPRNKGVQMAKAPCIIFHDPDNEGIMDGYAALYDALQKNPETDLTIGNTVRCDGRLMTFDYYSILKKRAGGVSFANCREMVADSNFLPANIQTMAIRRDFLLRNGLEQVPGGIGEDSLLCNQMMFAARRIEVVPVKVQIYYAERGDSIVNSVTARFFDKHLLTEVARVKWIVPAGLMEPYVKNRYATYVTGWYFDKLRHADPECAADCARKLYEILKLYDGYYKGGCKEIDTFLSKCRANDFQGAYEISLGREK